MPFVRSLATRLRVENRIDFRGWLRHTEIEQGYQSADIVVVPSIWDDPCPIVGIEAMASGKPVVAFDVGGISDWLRDKVTGLLVRDISPRGLAATVDSLLMDEDARLRMGAAAMEIAGEESGLDRHIDRLLEHLSRLIPKSESGAISI